jgi:hypothetical protein
MTLTSFNIIELSTASATILGALAMLLAQTQKSKCRNLKCCCGLIVCDRVVPEDKEGEEEEEEQVNTEVDLESGEKTNKTELPKVELPKVELPKVELPKVNIVVKK